MIEREYAAAWYWRYGKNLKFLRLLYRRPYHLQRKLRDSREIAYAIGKGILLGV